MSIGLGGWGSGAITTDGWGLGTGYYIIPEWPDFVQDVGNLTISAMPECSPNGPQTDGCSGASPTTPACGGVFPDKPTSGGSSPVQ